MMAVTPLHVSSEQGHVDIVNYLIPQGGDVNRKDEMGKDSTPSGSKEGTLGNPKKYN